MFTKLPGFVSLPGNLISFVSKMNASALAKSTEASMVIGRVLMVNMTAVNTGVSDPDMFFRGTYEQPIQAVIDAVNELVVIDREEAMRFARQLYSARHRIVAMTAVHTPITSNGYEDFFNLRLSIEPKYLEVMQANAPIMGELSRGFCGLIDYVRATN